MRWALVGFAVLLAACGGGSEAPVTELDRAQQEWAARGPHAYHFTLGRVCFCGPVLPDDPRSGAITVVVRNDVVQRAFYARSGLDVDPVELARSPSISGLFRIAQDAAARDAAIVRPVIDPAFGHLRSLYIDYFSQAADDEIEYVVSDFEVDP